MNYVSIQILDYLLIDFFPFLEIIDFRRLFVYTWNETTARSAHAWI